MNLFAITYSQLSLYLLPGEFVAAVTGGVLGEGTVEQEKLVYLFIDSYIFLVISPSYQDNEKIIVARKPKRN